MQFDLFHSLGRVDNIEPRLNDARVFEDFFGQVKEAEGLGFETLWVAESHFSSEVQKNNPHAVIPQYQGELGLNCDFGQLAAQVFARTKSINFGTAIHNVVGGNGGPICSADRVKTLQFYNSISPNPRHLYLGVASGRFPYINRPFGIVPRNAVEEKLWPQYKRLIFLEAYEIFYRLVKGEILSSEMTRDYCIDQSFFTDEAQFEMARSGLNESDFNYVKRWQFDPLKLVPEVPNGDDFFTVVLGSHDPKARELAFELGDPDIFNLSFTPPEKLNAIHDELFSDCKGRTKEWHRNRLPRTVLIFIDENERVAIERAEKCFDTYIDAMAGTVKMPPRQFLMDRALIGTPAKILDEIQDSEKNGFHPDDKIMAWFEFNQKDQESIINQMRLFAGHVMSKLK